MGESNPAMAMECTDTSGGAAARSISAAALVEAVTLPTAPLRTPRSKRSYGISLYHAWCKRCSICGEFCPSQALVNDDLGVPHVVDDAKCTGCMQCVHRCPDFCVEVYEKAPTPAPAIRSEREPHAE